MDKFCITFRTFLAFIDTIVRVGFGNNVYICDVIICMRVICARMSGRKPPRIEQN